MANIKQSTKFRVSLTLFILTALAVLVLSSVFYFIFLNSIKIDTAISQPNTSTTSNQKNFTIGSNTLSFTASSDLQISEGTYGISITSQAEQELQSVNIHIAHSENFPTPVSETASLEEKAKVYADYHISSTAGLGNFNPVVTSISRTKINDMTGVLYQIYLQSPAASMPEAVYLYMFPRTAEELFVVWDYSRDMNASGKVISSIIFTSTTGDPTISSTSQKRIISASVEQDGPGHTATFTINKTSVNYESMLVDGSTVKIDAKLGDNEFEKLQKCIVILNCGK
jgi:hypothetical protein